MTERQCWEVLAGRYLARARQARQCGDLREALRLISASVYAAKRVVALGGAP